MKAYDTLWGYRPGDQWLGESTGLSTNPYGSLFSLRSGFTPYFVLSPVNGSFATVAPEKLASQELDASTAASGPHDFAVRVTRARRAHASRPPHPTARS